jgi:tyrosine-protein kinase Etk/Wzc
MSEKDFFQFESEGADIKGTLSKYLKYWYLIVLSVIIALTVAYVYLRYSTAQYEVKSTLLVKDDKNVDLASSAVFDDLGIFKAKKLLANEMQILKSRGLMHRVFEELSLYTNYFVEGNIKVTEVYGEGVPFKLLVSQLDSAAFGKAVTLQIKDNNTFVLSDEDGKPTTHKFGREVKKPYAVFTVVASSKVDSKNAKEVIIIFNDIRQQADSYNGRLNIESVDKNSSVLSVSLIDPTPKKGEDIINKLIEVYNKEAVEDKNQMASNTIDFIDERLQFLTVELTNVEKDVERYKKENNLTDVSADAEIYLQGASEYRKQLADYEIQIEILNSIEKYLNKQGNQFELVPSTLNIQDPTLMGLIGNFNQLQLERQRMLRTTQENNPLVQNMNDQLFNLKANILENLRNIKNGLVITRNNLRASNAQFESRIQRVPSIERELLEISRQQGIKEGLYLYLLQKREEAALSLAATVSNTRILDPAMAGGSPVKPDRRMIYLLALVIGLGLPIAGIFLKDALNDKVQELKDVTNVTNTPILGEIAWADTNETVVVTHGSRSSIAEMFRLIRTNLQFATAGKTNQVILVTSSMSGEGKTFFSINLAASLILTGKKAVVLGFDLRKPKLTQVLNMSNEVGISNFLISEGMDLNNIIQTVPGIPDLSIIGSGPTPPNPSELMALPRVETLINELKSRFDYIIVDTAPLGQVADAFTLEKYIDSTIYLVRYKYTYKEQIRIVDDIYKNKKLKYPMVVFNNASKHNSYGYGYGYGSGYGYHDEMKKASWMSRITQKAYN